MTAPNLLENAASKPVARIDSSRWFLVPSSVHFWYASLRLVELFSVLFIRLDRGRLDCLQRGFVTTNALLFVLHLNGSGFPYEFCWNFSFAELMQNRDQRVNSDKIKPRVETINKLGSYTELLANGLIVLLDESVGKFPVETFRARVALIRCFIVSLWLSEHFTLQQCHWCTIGSSQVGIIDSKISGDQVESLWVGYQRRIHIVITRCGFHMPKVRNARQNVRCEIVAFDTCHLMQALVNLSSCFVSSMLFKMYRYEEFWKSNSAKLYYLLKLIENVDM